MRSRGHNALFGRTGAARGAAWRGGRVGTAWVGDAPSELEYFDAQTMCGCHLDLDEEQVRGIAVATTEASRLTGSGERGDLGAREAEQQIPNGGQTSFDQLYFFSAFVGFIVW